MVMEKKTGQWSGGAATACLIFLLLLLASREGGVVMVEGRTCESQSHGFKGRCVSSHNCGLVCRNEGFTDGWCRGFRGRCFCTRPC
ncbi:Defensin-like protein 2 [Sesamum angolense]|uniref:Defensin-like protein 2 n=1 Tax=Sesamum angolense TaxID=2727404 RepID=A0AAE1WT60_9LAMI|nr:Defensin-like protein 2 [Sesamum angolense]